LSSSARLAERDGGGKQHCQARVFSQREHVVALTVGNKLAAVHPEAEFVEAGGLLSYGANLSDLFRRAAFYVDKIFKGTKPAEIPIEQAEQVRPFVVGRIFTRGGAGHLEFVGLPQLFRESDIVIVHAPLTESTHHLINREQLALIRPGGIIINVSRGGGGRYCRSHRGAAQRHLSAAGLDVLESEPEVPPELRAQSGAMLTPHVAFTSDTFLLDLRKRAAEKVVRVLSGELPRYPCNKPRMK
jgi:D-isomer specific 2-hydroxyacid dehydrogenase, NAD binding domain/ABC transporter substrate binding protein